MTAGGWLRFWYPWSGSVRFDDQGYVRDPERTELFRSLNPDLVPFDAIRGKRILALLGEPGSGKSYALRDEFQRVRAAGRRAKLVDLKEYSDESRLIRDSFETDMISAEGERFLFLDSLDEALIRLETLSSLVVSELERLPQSGLFIRIACRTADWPQSLDAGLVRLANTESTTRGSDAEVYAAYVLAPLRRRDIAQAALSAGLDADVFLDWIERIPAVALAIKPLTLSLLIGAFGGKDKPATQVELYDRGCRYLLEEPDLVRRERRRTSASSVQRLGAAKLCAAALILGGRRAIWRAPDLGAVPEDTVLLDEIVESSKIVGPALQVSQLKELLCSALFTTRGRAEEIAFEHQTYGEYLAARFLVDHDPPLAQLVEVLTQGEERLVIPQLRETAAWVAQMRRDFYRFLLERDPKVLLRSNVATGDQERRKELVDALLHLYAEGRLFDDWDARHYYALLAHPALAAQVRPTILNRNQPFVARAGAIALAETNAIDETGPDLLRVALDATNDVNLRINAAYAIARRGSRGVREQMRPLLHDAGDRDHELRGCALRALWPEFLSPRDLFAELQPEGTMRLFGAYQGFLLSDVLPSLKDSDLVDALEWVRDRSRDERGMPFHYDGLADGIVGRAAQLVGDAAIRHALAEALVARQRHRQEMLSQRDAYAALADQDIRRAIATTAVESDGTDSVPFEVTHGSPPILWPTDREWIIEQGLAATDDDLVRRWARVAEMFVGSDDEPFFAQLYEAAEGRQPFKVVFEAYFAAIPLDSEAAKWLRQRESRRAERRPLLDPAPSDRIEGALRAIEAGDVDRWWILNREMTLDADSTHYEWHRIFEPDLRKSVGWKEASAEVHARVVSAARRFVLDHVPGPSDWLGLDIFKDVDFAGYRAFVLLLAEDRAFLEGLAPEVWKRWAIVLAGYPAFGENDAVQRELLGLALPHAAPELIGAFEVLLTKDCRQHDHPFFLRSIPETADSRLSDMLLRLVMAHSTTPACVGALLERLFNLQNPSAIEWASQRITRPGHAKTRQRLISVHAARALLLSDSKRAWPLVWRSIVKTPDYGRELFLSIAEIWDRKDWLGSLTEAQTADLYMWLEHQFPHPEDPPREGAVPPRAELADLRDRLVQMLGRVGTTDAVAALRRIRATFATEEYRWIDRVIVEATDLAAARSWAPVDLKGLAALVGDGRRHLVESERALQDAVVEALARLQLELRDETPAVVDLWEFARDHVRPKDELSVSNYVRRFLKRDLAQRGIAVNREVEIRDANPTGAGQLLDLRIDATQNANGGRFDVVSVFVEVKASWSPDLMTAMRAQLVGRYLQDTTVRHGIFIAGWFASARWDSRDRRKAQSERRSLEHVQSELALEAERLSGTHLRVVPFVLDASLRDEDVATTSRTRARRRARPRQTERAGAQRRPSRGSIQL